MNENNELFRTISKIAGYQLPDEIRCRFLAAHKKLWIDECPPSFEHLFNENQKWVRKFSEDVFGSIQSGFMSAYYHKENINFLENEVTSFCATNIEFFDLKKSPFGGGLCAGNTHKIDFEFQAFQFSIRRTLEYIAVAIGSFFKTDAHRFRTIKKTITGKKPTSISERFSIWIDKVFPELSGIINLEKQDRTLRDQLAHYQDIPAGHLQLWWDKSGFAIGLGGKVVHPYAKKALRKTSELNNNVIREFGSVSKYVQSQMTVLEKVLFEFFDIIQL